MRRPHVILRHLPAGSLRELEQQHIRKRLNAISLRMRSLV